VGSGGIDALAQAAQAHGTSVTSTRDQSTAIHTVHSLLTPGDVVLIKASRAENLNLLADQLLAYLVS
jgi:UDP-N-acetylmuramyl pentapeptide synthase